MNYVWFFLMMISLLTAAFTGKIELLPASAFEMAGTAVNIVLGLINGMITSATPILLAALGGSLTYYAGIFNIAMEGMMLSGAFGGVLGSFLFHNPWIGLLTAMACGGLVGLIHAFVSVTVRGDQVVSGVAINITMLGLTTFLSRRFFEVGQRTTVSAFSVWEVPILSEIPIVGDIFFKHVPLVYLAYLLVPACAFLLYRTSWGLKIRAVGEQPLAADTVGVNVAAWRYALTIICGALAALGGAFLSLGQLDMFLDPFNPAVLAEARAAARADHHRRRPSGPGRGCPGANLPQRPLRSSGLPSAG